MPLAGWQQREHLDVTTSVLMRPEWAESKKNVLPKGFELVACGAPGIVTTQSDGRVRVSFFNDRDDELTVRLRGRRLP